MLTRELGKGSSPGMKESHGEVDDDLICNGAPSCPNKLELNLANSSSNS
jgi:hypothetical protein